MRAWIVRQPGPIEGSRCSSSNVRALSRGRASCASGCSAVASAEPICTYGGGAGWGGVARRHRRPLPILPAR